MHLPYTRGAMAPFSTMMSCWSIGACLVAGCELVRGSRSEHNDCLHICHRKDLIKRRGGRGKSGEICNSTIKSGVLSSNRTSTCIRTLPYRVKHSRSERAPPLHLHVGIGSNREGNHVHHKEFGAAPLEPVHLRHKEAILNGAVHHRYHFGCG